MAISIEQVSVESLAKVFLTRKDIKFFLENYEEIKKQINDIELTIKKNELNKKNILKILKELTPEDKEELGITGKPSRDDILEIIGSLSKEEAEHLGLEPIPKEPVIKSLFAYQTSGKLQIKFNISFKNTSQVQIKVLKNDSIVSNNVFDVEDNKIQIATMQLDLGTYKYSITAINNGTKSEPKDGIITIKQNDNNGKKYNDDWYGDKPKDEKLKWHPGDFVADKYWISPEPCPKELKNTKGDSYIWIRGLLINDEVITREVLPSDLSFTIIDGLIYKNDYFGKEDLLDVIKNKTEKDYKWNKGMFIVYDKKNKRCVFQGDVTNIPKTVGTELKDIFHIDAISDITLYK